MGSFVPMFDSSYGESTLSHVKLILGKKTVVRRSAGFLCVKPNSIIPIGVLKWSIHYIYTLYTCKCRIICNLFSIPVDTAALQHHTRTGTQQKEITICSKHTAFDVER